MNLLDKLERKFGRFAIKGLPLYIVSLNMFVFLLTLIQVEFLQYLILVPSLVLKGEVWRLVTYIFIPPQISYSGIPWILFALYLYFIFASGLEHEWGSFKFNIYYFIGMLGTTVAAFIIPIPATSSFIDLSIFLAFAYLYPDYEIRIFMIIPVKVKYLGWLSWAYIIFQLIVYPWIGKLYVIIPILNFFLFFGKDIYIRYKTRGSSIYRKRKYREGYRKKQYVHKCTVCGITEKDNPDMDFRYCLSCEGSYEYCMDHLKSHEHKKAE
jgi:membrane associated rhomboid family serine protease